MTPTLSYLHDYFSYPDNNGHDPDNETMLLHVAMLIWIIEDMLIEVRK